MKTIEYCGWEFDDVGVDILKRTGLGFEILPKSKWKFCVQMSSMNQYKLGAFKVED